MEVTYDEIIDLVKKHTPNKDVKISFETKLLEDLEYDSLAMIELFDEIEEKYHIDCMENEMMYQALSTVQKLFLLIQEKVGEE